MNYQETLNWMFNQLPMYQQQGASAYKADLTNSILQSNYLGKPENDLKFIHIAGTNGKGSTSHLLASALQEAGYKVGLYTSPHLKDFRERIKIISPEVSGEITEEFVCEFIEKHINFFKKNELSFFEMTVGLAFEYFKKEKIDIAIIEVGLGGRLDSTNIITPLISVITNIGKDHVQLLGNTLEAIANEKAGIIKKDIPVVIGEYIAETKPVFLAKANEMKSEIYFASETISDVYPSDLKGNYQISNKKTAVQTLRILNSIPGFEVSEAAIKKGFLNVVKNTGLQGRWQQLNSAPKTICDTAHNKHGLEIVINQLKTEQFDTLHFVFGVVNDKDLDEILPLFPKNAIYYFCKPNMPRGLDAKILEQKSQEFGLTGKVYNSVSEAYTSAKENAVITDFIYIGGSNFVVAEIL
jgi:dihydrofolate synthase/folylpolyglutamate synthase